MSRKKLIVTAIVLTLILAIGGILAYFTSTDTKVNRFKMSNVGITVSETEFPGDPLNEADKVPIVPNQEIPKNPTVTNNGDGDVYAFVVVEIPHAEVKTSVGGDAEITKLFTVRKIVNETTKETAEGYDDDNWVCISEDYSDDSVICVYAYGTEDELTKLGAGETTTPVFDAVKFASVVETTNVHRGSLQGTDLEVKVSGYGIQVEGIESTDPYEVFQLVSDQYDLGWTSTTI